MGALKPNLILLPDRLVMGKRRNFSLSDVAQSMSSRHICPCCSNVLLRHIRLGKLYWRCNHCYQAMPGYQAMPAMKDLKEAQFLALAG